jgi:chorismate mutase
LEVSQKAMDLNFDGLMIETHPNPDKAWSDAAQQVTPDGLKDILSQLILRTRDFSSIDTGAIDELRLKITNLDDRLFDILSARMNMSEEVGRFKLQHNITILQQERWIKIIESRLSKSDNYQLSERFIRQIMDAIHQESIRHQTKVMNKRNEQ